MEKLHKVTVNNSYHFNFKNEELSNLDAVKLSESEYHILKNNKSFFAEVLQSDFNKKTYSIKVNGNHYEVKISDTLDLLIEKLGLEASTQKKENNIKAPMPGLIVSIEVKQGQEVAEGNAILVLEAMKMENTLTAPRSGIIKNVAVKKGDKVEKNTVLIEIE